MNWRRLADVLRIRSAGQLKDERSIRREHLREQAKLTHAVTVAVKEMTAQSQLGSYGRVRLPR